MKKQFLVPFLILLFLILGTSLVILYGRGYRFTLERGKPDFSGTGLLVATSTPDGAQVLINDRLTTATNNTINLVPGEYAIKIFKEGFLPWEKRVKIQKEVVTKVEAFLFPNAPKLESITALGVENPVIDPSLTKIAYTVSSQSAKKNGIYVLDITTKPILTLQSASIQIIDDVNNEFSKAIISWSPDGREILATISANPATYLLKTNGYNQAPQDITDTIALTESKWQKEKDEKEKALYDSLKPLLRKMISENFTVISWSLDETKILYRASNSATLPIIINPRLIGIDSTPEERLIKKDSIYVYDIKEDKNFRIDTKAMKLENGNLSPKPINWFFDSEHLVFVSDKKIYVVEYDGTNSNMIYAGPFIDNYVFSSPNEPKILMLTSFNNVAVSPNLYTIGLK